MLRQAHPEEGIERSVLHEFCDDEDGAAPRQDALEPDHVRVVELAHDGGLGQEVPPLTLGVAGFQRLNGHHHLPATGLLETSAAHLPKFAWIERTRWGGKGRRGEGDRGEGLSEQRKEEEGWRGRGSRRESAGRGNVSGRIRE